MSRFMCSATNDDYNTLDEVATEVKDSLATIDLPARPAAAWAGFHPQAPSPEKEAL